MKRKIIKIDDKKCTGCGLCMPNCPEGAIQIIDGKARLVSDLFCDGLGACLGHCPEGAISIEEREAEPYNERKVIANIVKQGNNVVKAHIEHLKAHGETAYLNEALNYLKENDIEISSAESGCCADNGHNSHFSGCPGAKSVDFENQKSSGHPEKGKRESRLTHWPVQLHLISPMAPQYHGKDVILSADCVAYALADFHKDYLKGKALAIACPKLDEGQEIYVEKITALIEQAEINTLTVMIMQVPCCRGLLQLAQEAAQKAKRKIPVKLIVVGIQGEILEEKWMK